MVAEKLVMMIDATSSNGRRFSPSAVLHVSWPSRQLSEHCGESMLTMWKLMFHFGGTACLMPEIQPAKWGLEDFQPALQQSQQGSTFDHAGDAAILHVIGRR